MKWLWWLAGGALGLGIDGIGRDTPGLAGLIFGVVCAWLVTRTVRLNRELRVLERRLSAMSPGVEGAQPQSLPPTIPTREAAAQAASGTVAGTEKPHGGTPPMGGEAGKGFPEGPALPSIVVAPPVEAAHGPLPPGAGGFPPGAGGPPPRTGPSFPQRIKGWFQEGNVPVKVGVVVLFAGVSALLKYASDEGWLRLPIELRLAAVAVASIGALIVGFRQVPQRRAFGVSLQGGAVGILTLTIFAAFRLYGLLPAPLAFALLVLLVTGAGILAALQRSMSLAVLGSLAGFLAPILVSDGTGNHLILFGWYALLNTGIFAMAWIRTWRVLNLLGFVCTFGVASAWGVLRYDPDRFATTEPFLLLFFLFYLAIPILHAWKQPGERRGWVDGSLVFGTPLFSFGFQAILLDGAPLPLAVSALVIASVYVALAFFLLRKPSLGLLGESHAVLAVGFATLTVPLALSGEVTASVFALEGAALVWLGLKQRRLLPRVAGLGLQALAGLSWLQPLSVFREDTLPLANGPFLGALLLAVGGWTSAWLFWRARPLQPQKAAGGTSPLPWKDHGYGITAGILTLWGLVWWSAAWLGETGHFLHEAEPDGWLVVAVATAWLAAEALRLLDRAPGVPVGIGTSREPTRTPPLGAGAPSDGSERVPPGAGAPSDGTGTAAQGEGPPPRSIAPLLPWISALGLSLAAPIVLFQTTYHRHPFGGMGPLAWALFAAFGTRALVSLGRVGEDTGHAPVSRGPLCLAHLGWLWAWPLALSFSLSHVADRAPLGSSWMVPGLPLLVFHGVALLRPTWLAAPLPHRFFEYRSSLLTGQAVALTLLSFVLLWFPGDSAPLPWIPLFNPQDLLGALWLALTALWLADPDAPRFLALRRWGWVAAWGFVWITIVTLRAVHHLGDEPWLGDMFSGSLTQTSLSVVWSLLGVAGWIIGSRKGNRPLWLLGAVLMGGVLLKLALVDRQHLGDLAGIVSFLAYGLLCTAVGYLAPAPVGREETTPDLGDTR